MKAIINKSRLMKEAHKIRRTNEVSMSEALTIAWVREKIRAEDEKGRVKPQRVKTNYNSPLYQNSMIEYYNRGSGVYYGD